MDKQNKLPGALRRPVVSTRYDKDQIAWALAKTGLTPAQLLKRALDEYIAKLLTEGA